MTRVLFQHLVLSTMFAVLAGAVVLIRNSDSAGFRYRMWLVAALNFAIPTAAFVRLGVRLQSLVPVHLMHSFVHPSASQDVGRFGHAWPQVAGSVVWLPSGLFILWSFGAVGTLSLWASKFRSHRPTFSEAPRALVNIVNDLCRRIGLRRRVTVRSPATGCDLTLYGTFHSFLLVPPSFSDSLDHEELEAVLVHELMHVRRWDNLAAIIVHLITCMFWFHPALWWIERRLVIERELACDEGVIDHGWPTNTYATGILKLCRFHFAELQAGTCGFSGASLRERMERIMLYKPTASSRRTNVILPALATALTLVPVTVGFIGGRPIYAQAHAEARQRDASCVFADKKYPEGAIIHQDGGNEQLCVMALARPTWVRTSAEIRQRGQSVIELPPTPVQKTAFCTPKMTSSKRNCSCEEGGPYSPGSRVDSSKGMLSCVAGRWNTMDRKNK